MGGQDGPDATLRLSSAQDCIGSDFLKKTLPERVPPAVLLRSLNSHTCPGCGKAKEPATPLCDLCLLIVPRGLRGLLNQRFGQGYELAMRDAVRRVCSGEFHLPKGG